MFLNSMLLLISLFPSCISTDTITPGQSITHGKSLISRGNLFELGFFRPGNFSNSYLGIWYVNKGSEQTVVWVANRNNPINDSFGALTINRFGNLVLYSNQSDHQIWSTNLTVNNSTVAQLLDTGNLVLIEDGNKGFVWQSFDYPTNTLLPGMKFGIDRKKGLDRVLISWKSPDDPGMGVYSFKLNPSGSPQTFTYKDSTPYWRSSPWPWTSHSWISTTNHSARIYAFNYTLVSNQDETYSAYSVDDSSITTRFVIDESGLHKPLIWQDDEGRWKELYVKPRYSCDKYGLCGAYGKCNSNHYDNIFQCTCLPGYEPSSPRNWSMKDGSGGCIRKKQWSECGKEEGFLKLGPLKLPDSSNAIWLDIGTSTNANCEQTCLKNCSCTAFAILNIPDKGTSCLAWYGELLDIQENVEGGRELHVRVGAIEQVENVKQSKGFFAKKGKLAIPIVPATLGLFIVLLIVYLYLMKKRKMKGERIWRKHFDITQSSTCSKDNIEVNELEESRRNPYLPIFSLGTLVSATNNFSEVNKLGQGGFGSVYKGQLSSGLDIAVKRLSKISGQGIKEFKNEVMLIAKLQHRNLVKLLGYCIEDVEKMLVYEYMPNNSLDSFIFDETRKSFLNWRKRFVIIVGIARGILYLHQDSRLRIIHRDLKASNILLDAEMNPKISDFGMARIFREDQTQENTHKIVGTYGYMSPEYVVFGKFSVKSDVFSFGIILLEIITGKKNSGSYEGPSLNLIGDVWDLWREDNAMEIVDSILLKEACTLDVLRCIQIGLLCLQEDAADRPTMLAVVLMLNGETDLPYPKKPAFIFRRNNTDSDPIKVAKGSLSPNDTSMSDIEAR